MDLFGYVFPREVATAFLLGETKIYLPKPF